MICVIAWASVFRGLPSDLAPATALLRFDGLRGSTAQFSPHLPAYPQQQDPACEQQADNLQDLRRHPREQNAQQRRGDDADQNRLASLRLGQARGSEADDNGVVTSEHQIDQNDLKKCGQDICGEKFEHGSRSPSCRENGPSSDAVLARCRRYGFTNTCRKPVPHIKAGPLQLNPVRHRSLLAARGARPGDCLLSRRIRTSIDQLLEKRSRLVRFAKNRRRATQHGECAANIP